MTKEQEEFIKLLKDMFQFEQADLDFGIYKIMNAKRDEINRFLNEDLPHYINEGLSVLESSTTREQINNIDEQIAIIKKGNLPEVVKEQTLAGLEKQKEELKFVTSISTAHNEIYNHLLNFFSRYYDEGDFISQRRYSKDKYAIPYEGEEVKLHWATADQYYIKTSEYFKDYTFSDSYGYKVHFKITDAKTEQNNNKSKDKKFFQLTDKEKKFEIIDGELYIYIEYKEGSKKQKDYNEEILISLCRQVEQSDYANFNSIIVKERGQDKSLLEKHLNRYTARNSFDYFIHKDLRGFLNRELDFYIKNEVIRLDDIDENDDAKIKLILTKSKVLRNIAKDIISFLSQLEDFQKKLFLKKKFVTETNYCITLDRINEEFYDEIASNEQQRKEWVKLFAIDEIKSTTEDIFSASKVSYTEPLTKQFLKENPYLVLDTAFFSEDFKERIVGSIDDFDEKLDGLLLNGDNYHSLNLLKSLYQENISYCYIDPPYNTKKNEFIFKDNFKHSSWISMMYDRLLIANELLSKDSAIMISCDENEITNLRLIFNSTFGETNYLSDIVWQGGAKNDQKYLSVSHEYIVTGLKDKLYLDSLDNRWTERKPGLDKIYNAFENIRKKYPNDYEMQSKQIKLWFNSLPDSDPAKRQKHYSAVDERGLYFPDNISKPENGYYYEVLHPVTGLPCKKPKGGWRYIESTMKIQLEEKRVHFGVDEKTVPCRKSYLKETEYESPNTVIYLDNRVSTSLLIDLFNDKKIFDNPKYYLLISRLINMTSKNNSTVLDFFAGSGTTAHAVIHLNREDNGNRKYILCEMGDYFDTVTKPRVEKVIYSKEWKDGKPVSREGSSHAFK